MYKFCEWGAPGLWGLPRCGTVGCGQQGLSPVLVSSGKNEWVMAVETANFSFLQDVDVI